MYNNISDPIVPFMKNNIILFPYSPLNILAVPFSNNRGDRHSINPIMYMLVLLIFNIKDLR